MIPPFADDSGHRVFTSARGTPPWTAAVATFFRTHEIALPF
jgi:hypothetical protein